MPRFPMPPKKRPASSSSSEKVTADDLEHVAVLLEETAAKIKATAATWRGSDAPTETARQWQLAWLVAGPILSLVGQLQAFSERAARLTP